MSSQELKVLLIEDNPGDAFLIKFYLGESAEPIFHVSHAETVKSALDFLSENSYDIILSDMNLPDSFGIDTIKTILGKHPGNLVMVLTGLSDEEVGLETVRYGAQDFLVKGKFDGKVLVSSVMFAFERFKLNKQIDSVSKKLNEENYRLDSFQKMMNAGFIEIDPKTNMIFRTNFTLDFLGLPGDSSIISLDDSGAAVENFGAMKDYIINLMATGNKGEYLYKRSDNQSSFKLYLEKQGDKYCGVITRVE